MNHTLEFLRRASVWTGFLLFFVLLYFVLTDRLTASEFAHMNPVNFKVVVISALTGIVCLVTLFGVIHSDKLSVYQRGCLQLFLFILFIYLICIFPTLFIGVVALY